MKKIFAMLLSVLFLISLGACDNSSGEPLVPEDTPPASTESVTPSPAPTEVLPSAVPDDGPDDEPASPDSSADEPAVPDGAPEPEDELTVYINNSPVTVTATEFNGILKANVLEFSLKYDAAEFTTDFRNNAYMITPAREDASPLDYMEISFINGGTADSILPSFADSYIDFSDIEFASYAPVGELGTSAESVIAYNAEQYINAYLIDVSGGVVTIVLSSTGHSSEPFIWFNAFLGTFAIK